MINHSWRTIVQAVFVATALALVSACGVSTVTVGSGATNTPAAPTATPTPSCATLLPGAHAAAAIAGFEAVSFPAGTVVTGPTTSGAGAGQFTVTTYQACFTGMTNQVIGAFHDHNSIAATLLGSGWGVSTTFPYDAQLQTNCAGNCYDGAPSDPIQPARYAGFDQVTDHGNSLITFRARLAAPPALPTCNSNFNTAALPGYQLTAFGMPLPPLSRAAGDDAAGGVRGEDICSPGTVASITAFLTTELPATGWATVPGSTTGCIFSANCWKKGTQVISYQVGTDPTNWVVAYRAPFP